MSESNFTDERLETLLRSGMAKDAKSTTQTPVEMQTTDNQFSDEKLEKILSSGQTPTLGKSAADEAIAVGSGIGHVPDVLGRGLVRLAGFAPGLKRPSKFLLEHDPLNKAFQSAKGLGGATAGEIGAALMLPAGALGEGASLVSKILPLVLKQAGLAGLASFGGERSPTAGEVVGSTALGGGLAAGGAALTEGLGAPIARSLRKTKLVSDLSQGFKNFMKHLSGKLHPQEKEFDLQEVVSPAEAELQKAITQKPQANKFMNDLQDIEGTGNKVPEEKIPSILADETSKLHTKLTDLSRNKYDDAFESAKKAGKFGLVFPTASQAAKGILKREESFSARNIPRSDIDKTLETVKGISEGGSKEQDFESATESIKRLREMSRSLGKDDNMTASSMLSGLANDVENDAENSLRQKAPDALQKWKESNNFWRRNVLPLREHNIQKAISGSGKIGNLHNALLDPIDKDLPPVLEHLSEKGKKALAFQSLRDSLEQDRFTKQRQPNPKRLFNIFEKKFEGENLPFIRSLVGEDGINKLRDIGANRLSGIDENVERLSKGLGKMENAPTFAQLGEKDKNIILFNHFKHALDEDGEMNVDKFNKLHSSINKDVEKSLLENNPETADKLPILKKLAKEETADRKLPKAEREKSKTRADAIKNLLRFGSLTAGVITGVHGGGVVGGLGVGSTAILPEILKLLSTSKTANRLRPAVIDAIRTLGRGQQGLLSGGSIALAPRGNKK